MITRIRVPSEWEDFKQIAPCKTSGIADFQLGPGPCGKIVERLECDFMPYGVEITQVCTCHKRKVFVYPWSTVLGRVEVTHGHGNQFKGPPRDYD